MTTGARHLAPPPPLPLLPEPPRLTNETAGDDDDVEEGDGTEVMLVFGMPGMLMCVGTPLLTTLLELRKLKNIQFICRKDAEILM